MDGLPMARGGCRAAVLVAALLLAGCGGGSVEVGFSNRGDDGGETKDPPSVTLILIVDGFDGLRCSSSR